VRAALRRLVGGAGQEEDHTKWNSKPAAVDQRYRIYDGCTTDISGLPAGCVAPNQMGYTVARYQPTPKIHKHNEAS